MAFTPETSNSTGTMESNRFIQEPIAVVGMACRLPGHSDSPRRLWEFLMRNGVAGTDVPAGRFNLNGFYDGSDRPHTFRSPGAMFMETVNPAEFDASFFNIPPQEAISMDPQQRILLEVIYEALEGAGIPLESLAGEKYGCFVGAHTGDYWDVFARDPDSRPPNAGIGGSATMLSNRVSHFLDIKGPSSLVALDTACKSLHIGEINGAIVAASGLILNPDYGCDAGSIKSTHSPTGRCHTFDAKADGYIKAEGVNVVILKRLDDAIQDRDPIRAVIRGSANNHNGRTAGIASPNADIQAAAVRQAYANANITDYSLTAYLECHGTGTMAGDPVETTGIASVFASSRTIDKPLRIGSIKSNIGHSESAAGLSGMMKGIMIIETGLIPGNPTFVTPNPEIDFHGLKLDVRQELTPFPDMPFRRVGVNCFGFGGSNAHVILDEPNALVSDYTPAYVSSYRSPGAAADQCSSSTNLRPYLLCFSANKEGSLRDSIDKLTQHVRDPEININPRDLAYTMGVRRSHLFHRGYLITNHLGDLDATMAVCGKKSIHPPRIGFVFTGQGAQWPEMGQSLLASFQPARDTIDHLDSILQRLPDPPNWTILDELTSPRDPQHTRQPEFSQPLVTALQLALLAVLKNWGLSPQSVVGHSSGEIAASCAAGYISDEEAIILAYHRGKACQGTRHQSDIGLGMLAVGLGAEDVQEHLDECNEVQIACFNSPTSVTLSGPAAALESLKNRLTENGAFARMLQVDQAYHSKYMENVGEKYENAVSKDLPRLSASLCISSPVRMFSSVSGHEQTESPDVEYWRTNMVSPVRFDDAVREMLTSKESPNYLIELGPSGALKGPLAQIQNSLGGSPKAKYLSALHRGPESINSTLAVAGELFLAGAPISMQLVNEDQQPAYPRIVTDLPGYSWDHSTKYWFESTSSKDWRFKPFVHHDLLGSKIIGTSWRNPTFKKTLNLAHLPWLRDHQIGSDVIFPGSGYIAMAVEALYQVTCIRQPDTAVSSSNQLGYRLRNVRFDMALILEDGIEPDVYLTMSPFGGSEDTWYEFTVFSTRQDITTHHSSGIIRVQDTVVDPAPEKDIAPLEHALQGHSWTKAFAEIGFNYGPAFHLLREVETRAGHRKGRCTITLADPSSDQAHSSYPFHPAALDGVLRATAPVSVAGMRRAVRETLIPAMIDDFIINPNSSRPDVGMAVSSSYYSGRGRYDAAKSYLGDTSVYDPATGELLIRMTKLASHKVDLGTDPLAPHTLTHEVWKPDIATLTTQSLRILSNQYADIVSGILELALHKKPDLNVLEIDLDTGDLNSPWLDWQQQTERQSGRNYRFMALDPVSITDIRSQYDSFSDFSVDLMDPESSRLGLQGEEKFDLIILKCVSPLPDKMISVLAAINTLLSAEGRLLAIDFSATGRQISPKRSLEGNLDRPKFSQVITIPEKSRNIFLCSPHLEQEPEIPGASMYAVSFEEGYHFPAVLRSHLHKAGWQVHERRCLSEDIPERATVLVTDEVFSSVFTNISELQWDYLRRLVTSGCKVLWVTQGSQLTVCQPDNALAVGLFRSVRSEDPSATIMTLDVGSSDPEQAAPHILEVLRQMERPHARWITDSEYAERDGVLHVPRIVPYKKLESEVNAHIRKPTTQPLSQNHAIVQLRAERVGTLDGLQFVEIPTTPPPQGHVEIEICAAGLNFKDVAVTMGIVPENEHLLGLEGAGVICGTGAGVSKDLSPGTRVVFMAKGSLANRIQVPAEFVLPIPNALSHQNAATMPVVFCTALFAIFDIGNLQPGQTVLIHSAAGGVGMACIQLAQYIGADIYVTVGTEQKRRCLHEKFGIPYDRMFSSRSADFASDITKATQGQGIDVIVNSLTGDLLDATWRICADGGTMVEIGKRDIVERNYLAMDPFDRGCSYRAIDLSHPKLLLKLPSLLKRIFDLQANGYISPITPITTFPMDQIPEAFAYLRSGRHIGKVVICDQPGQGSEVSIRPMQCDLALTENLAYLMVGGLKGLCGSLAQHLAERGARHLVVMSRSGYADPRSQRVITNCRSLGCEVHFCRGDVLRVLDVRRAFMKAPVPIGGIIQGVMLLRDRPYETMTVDEYHQSIEGKLQGTWNLHHVSMERGLPLDFFLMLSSISSVVGSPGQANYAAANSFLDSFATYRRSMGLVAQTINLGVIEDVGVVAESDALTKRHQKSVELTNIPEAILHDMVDCSLRQQLMFKASPSGAETPSRLITGLTVPQDPKHSALRFDLRFRGLFVARASAFESATAANESDPVGSAVYSFHGLVRAGASVDELLEPCVQVLAARLGQMLRWNDGQQIEPERPLSVYGLDSLSTVELRNWIKAELGAELTTFDIVHANSLIMLAERLVNKVRRE
ncbi:polyketide synthase module [Aspergillus steynii IBT 23096]|uniref:Polyketide synthase module n=1 Tax=Aspergillus steynii IBT 23096 TaxID=1392250 RepID=A0A2I2G047_9EURO|nr:polyketide synthase module [Aspergillus steynii IBT 23096]PLB46253.1 polyketide synthase module [Aspergillus steynii IBT 23096]